MTLFDLLARSTAKDEHAPALVFREQTLTYGQLLAQVEGFAGGLAALKINRRARIGIMLPNGPQFVIAYFGAGRAGATAVPMNVLYRPDEARFILADAGAEVLVTAEPFRPLVRALLPHLPTLRHVIMVSENTVEKDEIAFSELCAHAPERPAGVRDHDMAVILYTSGTTGRPKGAMLTHRNLIANAESCREVLGARGDDSFLSALPLFHAFAAMVFMVLPISLGARVQLMERFTPAGTAQVIEQSRATIFGGVPSMFGLLLQAASDPRPDFTALRVCVSGGAPLPPEVWAAFEEAFDTKMVEGYGLTEASPVVSVNPPFGVRKPGSIGPVIPGIQARIIGSAGKSVGPGVIGELVIRGDSIMKGYLNRPEDTRQVLRRRWLYTGDLVRRDEDGYLYIAGRKKELILVGGLNVYPGEVERVLVEHPAVLEAAAFGVPDATRGEAVWAAVVLRPGAQASDKELLALCRENLASFKAPKLIEIVPELPKNALGKVVRHLLQQESLQRRRPVSKV